MKAEPFEIAVPEETLGDLRDRLARTRWPEDFANTGWEHGTNVDYPRTVVAYHFTVVAYHFEEE